MVKKRRSFNFFLVMKHWHCWPSINDDLKYEYMLHVISFYLFVSGDWVLYKFSESAEDGSDQVPGVGGLCWTCQFWEQGQNHPCSSHQLCILCNCVCGCALWVWVHVCARCVSARCVSACVCMLCVCVWGGGMHCGCECMYVHIVCVCVCVHVCAYCGCECMCVHIVCVCA